MSEYENYLAMFDDEFEQAEAPEFSELPDGRYQSKIDRIYFDQLQKTNDTALRIEFVIVAGDHTGRRIFYSKVINSKSMPFLKADLKRINIEPKPFSKVESYFPGVLDKLVEVQIKHSKPDKDGRVYQNTYINRLIGDSPAPAAPAKAAQAPAEDLPF